MGSYRFGDKKKKEIFFPPNLPTSKQVSILYNFYKLFQKTKTFNLIFRKILTKNMKRLKGVNTKWQRKKIVVCDKSI